MENTNKMDMLVGNIFENNDIMNPGEQIDVAKRTAFAIPNVNAKIAGQLLTSRKEMLKPFVKTQGGLITGKSVKEYATELKGLLSNPISTFNMPVALVIEGNVNLIDRFSNFVHSKESYIETIISNEKMFASLNIKKSVTMKNDAVNAVKYLDIQDIYGSKIYQPRNLGYVFLGQNGESGQGTINLEVSYTTEDGLAWTQTLDVSPKSKDWAIVFFPVTAVENFNTVLIGLATTPYSDMIPIPAGHSHHIVAVGVNSDSVIDVMPIHASGVRQMFDLIKASI